MNLTLADLFSSDDNSVIVGQIENINEDGTVDLTIAGGTVADVPVLGTYTPQSGEVVVALRQNAAALLVLGAVRRSNATTVNFETRFKTVWNVTASSTASSGTLTVDPVSASAYRSSDGWGGRAAAVQGAYVTRWGYYHGAYFYGAGAFNSVRGRRATSATIKLKRANTGGTISNVPVYIALHAHDTRPGGAPVYTTGAKRIGVLDRDESATFTLPTSWAQLLLDGRAKGVGVLRDTTADYSIYAAPSSSNGRVVINWSS